MDLLSRHSVLTKRHAIEKLTLGMMCQSHQIQTEINSNDKTFLKPNDIAEVTRTVNLDLRTSLKQNAC